MIYENKLPYAHRSQDFKYLFENEVGKTLQEVCQDKSRRKAAQEGARMAVERLAKQFVQKYTDAMLKFKRGEIDPVSVLILKEEITNDYFKRASQIEYISQFDIKYIWENTWNSEKKKWGL